MQKKWLFVDFDNTLMATEQFGVSTLIERFNALYRNQIGRELTLDEFKQHFHGQARQSLCENLSKYFNINVDYHTLYHRREWRIMEFLQKLPQGITMAINVLDALNKLSTDGVVLSMVSNNPIQRAFAAMRFASNRQGEKLAHYFGTRFFEAGETQKPKPDVYTFALSQVGAEVEYSFAIEDSITGVNAAVSAGLKTYGYTGFADDPDEMGAKLREKGCIEVFHDWQMFHRLFER